MKGEKKRFSRSEKKKMCTNILIQSEKHHRLYSFEIFSHECETIFTVFNSFRIHYQLNGWREFFKYFSGFPFLLFVKAWLAEKLVNVLYHSWFIDTVWLKLLYDTSVIIKAMSPAFSCDKIPLNKKKKNWTEIISLQSS